MPTHSFPFPNTCLLLLAAALIVYLFFLWRFAKRKAAPEAFQLFQKPALRFAVVYFVYLAIVSVLAATGFFQVVTTPPRFLLFFLPLLAGAASLVRARRNSLLPVLSVVPPVALIFVQSFRIMVELLFLQFEKAGLLPLQLSFHGRNYDLLIGALSLPVGALFLAKHNWSQRAGILFNLLGLFSLGNIFSIVLFSVPSSFRIYDTFYLPGYFPGVTIVFLASLALYLHILSLKQLLWFNAKTLPQKKGIRAVVKPTGAGVAQP